MTEQEKVDAQYQARMKASQTIHDSIDALILSRDVDERANAVMNLYDLLNQVKEWKTE